MGKYEPQERYDAKMTRFIGLKLNKVTDADILDWLDEQPNKQGTIKEAIRHFLTTALTTPH